MSAQSGRARKYAEWLARVGPSARDARSFEAVLAERVTYAGDPQAQADEMRARFTPVYLEVIRSLLARAVRCRIYGLDELDPEPPVYREMPPVPRPARPAAWRSDYVRRVRGGVDANLGAGGILDDTDFWWWLALGASPVIVVERSMLDPAVDFAGFGDPRIIGNPGATTPRAALTFARRETDSGERVAFIPNPSEISVIAEAHECERLLRAVIEHGRLSSDFQRWYGTFRVQPLDIGGYDVWVRLNSNHNDWDIVRAALDPPGDERRATLDALVAAELVAALTGRPPASYGETEPKRAEGLAAWVARLAPTTPLGPEVRASARAVVERIATNSTLPDQLWLTEEPRTLWRAAMADLARRLA